MLNNYDKKQIHKKIVVSTFEKMCGVIFLSDCGLRRERSDNAYKRCLPKQLVVLGGPGKIDSQRHPVKIKF